MVVGEPTQLEEFEGDFLIQRNFLRVKCRINLNEPLKKDSFLTRNNQDDIWIELKYERLSDFVINVVESGTHRANVWIDVLSRSKGLYGLE